MYNYRSKGKINRSPKLPFYPNGCCPLQNENVKVCVASIVGLLTITFETITHLTNYCSPFVFCILILLTGDSGLGLEYELELGYRSSAQCIGLLGLLPCVTQSLCLHHWYGPLLFACMLLGSVLPSV